MKTFFTPFQIVLTTLSCAALSFCAAGDVLILTLKDNTVNEKLTVINLLLSVVAIILSAVFIFKTDIVNPFGKAPDENSDTEPAMKALRTYFCMLSFGFAGVMVLMLAGGLMYKNAVKAIAVFAPVVFVVAAVTYFIQVSRIGLDDYTDSEQDESSDDK